MCIGIDDADAIGLGAVVRRDPLSAGRFVASALIVTAIVQAEVTDPG